MFAALEKKETIRSESSGEDAKPQLPLRLATAAAQNVLK